MRNTVVTTYNHRDENASDCGGLDNFGGWNADVGVAVVHQIDLTWPQIDLKSTPSRLDLFQLT